MYNRITKVYCGHSLYQKLYNKLYITAIRQLAEALINGTALEVQPYSSIVDCPNPMFVTSGHTTIVFDPDYLKQIKN